MISCQFVLCATPPPPPMNPPQLPGPFPAHALPCRHLCRVRHHLIRSADAVHVQRSSLVLVLLSLSFTPNPHVASCCICGCPNWSPAVRGQQCSCQAMMTLLYTHSSDGLCALYRLKDAFIYGDSPSRCACSYTCTHTQNHMRIDTTGSHSYSQWTHICNDIHLHAHSYRAT